MIFSLPKTKLFIKSFPKKNKHELFEKLWSISTVTLALLCLIFIIISNPKIQKTISPLIPTTKLHPLSDSKKGYQVYGYAPYWMIDKLDNTDFSLLTTFAYFGVPIDSQGNLIQDDPGYMDFISDHATDLFKRAHDANTNVNLTITQMDNDTITGFLDNIDSQNNAINQIVDAVKSRGIDGVSVDFEYVGDPGIDYRNKFTNFVADLRSNLKKQIPQAQVTVAVYALSAKEPKLYDVTSLAKISDSIFMMAYDFATTGADNAQPTAPLRGYKEGKYIYDVSTAVEDFLKVMPANKLILGVPYYGYNYLVYQPTVQSETLPYWTWKGSPVTQTYDIATTNITPNMSDIDAYKTGWDDEGEVGFRAYHVAATNTWRMIFLEDVRSLGLKYDFAKQESLSGVGIWALGFDNGHSELWSLLRDKFGDKNLADSRGLLYK